MANCIQNASGHFLFFTEKGDLLIELRFPVDMSNEEKVESAEELMKLAIAWVGIEKEP